MRLLACLVGATAITSFLFLLVYSLAGVTANELGVEDACILSSVWAGSFVSGFFGPVLLNSTRDCNVTEEDLP